MAFKRSAVRSRLSPPNGYEYQEKVLKSMRFQDFFLLFFRKAQSVLESYWNGLFVSVIFAFLK